MPKIHKTGRAIPGRPFHHTLEKPGQQPELPILKPSRIYGPTADLYIRRIPDDVSEGFRTYCDQKGYVLRLAYIALIRWVLTNNIVLTGAYKEPSGEGVLHVRSVPLITARHFRAYCARHGYTLWGASACLLQWAVINDIDLAGAKRANSRASK